jgi:hypothetical protein
LAAGGLRGKLGTAGSSRCQAGASSVQIASFGVNRLGSSSDPALTNRRSKPRLPPETGVPQRGQKLRYAVLPEAAAAS